MFTDVLFFVSGAAGLAGQMLDSYTTDTAIAHGWTETVKPTAWLIKKIGLAGTLTLKCAGFGVIFPILITILSLHYGEGYAAGTLVAAGNAVTGFYAGIVNARRLKAAKISLF
jgi:hypothetical protein